MSKAKREIVLADVTTPLRFAFMPVVHLILATGMCSILLGLFDQPGGFFIAGTPVPPEFRVGVIGVWALWVTTRFVLPLISMRRARTVITPERIVARPRGIFRRKNEIPMAAVTHVQASSSSLVIQVNGWQRPYVVERVPRAAKLARIVAENSRIYGW